MPFVQPRWGTEIAVEHLNGVPYRMYSERPRDISELLSFCVRWGEGPHVVQGENQLSFTHLSKVVATKAGQLAASGVGAGDHVFIIGWNSIEWVINFWACLYAGAVPVLANTWWTATEIQNGLETLKPAIVLADKSIAKKIPQGWQIGNWDSASSEAGTVSSFDPPAGRDENQTAQIIFTSGTSGAPKAVVLSHRAVLARLHMTLQITRKLPQQVDEASRDVTLLTGPLFHVGNMQALLRAVVVGDMLVLSEGRYDPADVLQLIERHKVNRWNAVPTMVSRLLDHPDVVSRDLSSLKSISIGGAPVHAELMQRIRVGLPSVSPRIPTGYGLTENGGQATATAGADSIEKLGSTGRALPCVEIRFLEHPGLPDGEILLRSPTQMSGYFGVAQSPIDAEGWLHTGDLGRLDDKGNLWITGRSKDMIIRGGENIAPAAVERALMTIPGVIESVVFGLPHIDLGEEVMAVVVTDDRSITGDALAQTLRQKISSFAVPSRWHLQSEPLVTNQTGKVDKLAIREQMVRQRQEAGGV